MRYPIIIRMDDICPRMNKDKFINCLSFLESLEIKPLLGVIPDCQDNIFIENEILDFWEWIYDLNKKGYPIAMHGVHHVYSTEKQGIVCKRRKSEFSGLSYDEQYNLLFYGKEILKNHNIYTDVFMPPGHSYDDNTLKALNVVGFRYLTDGRSSWPYLRHGIKCIPAMGAYRMHLNRGVLTICIHSDTMKERDYNHLSNYLSLHKKRIISWEEALCIKNISLTRARFEEKINMNIDSLLNGFIKILNCESKSSNQK